MIINKEEHNIEGLLIHSGPDKNGYEVTPEAMLKLIETQKSFCSIPVFLEGKFAGNLPVGKITNMELVGEDLWATAQIPINDIKTWELIKNRQLDRFGFRGTMGELELQTDGSELAETGIKNIHIFPPHIKANKLTLLEVYLLLKEEN